MKTYNEIKEDVKKDLDGKSEKYIKRYLKLLIILRVIFSEKVLWIISIIPWLIVPCIIHFLGFLVITFNLALFFLIAHMLYWMFKGSKDTNKLIDESSPEIEMMIQVVKEIIDESKS
jgi:hypothetical protein